MAYPPGAAPGGTYTVPPSEVTLSIDELVLPDNFTINFDPSIRAVRWYVRSLQLGVTTLIDLSGQGLVPGPDLSKPDPPAQPLPGVNGANGRNGYQGWEGESGITFDLQVQTMVNVGSLWIRTDGAVGGPGGAAQDGGTGGDWDCLADPTGSPSIPPGYAAPVFGGFGGNGGNAPQGGKGGDTSTVTLTFNSVAPGLTLIPAGCAPASVEPSTRPRSAQGNTQIIAVWGRPGVGGPPGTPGNAGLGGGEPLPTKLCGTYILRSGPNGHPGQTNGQGPSGNCISSGARTGVPFYVPQRIRLFKDVRQS